MIGALESVVATWRSLINRDSGHSEIEIGEPRLEDNKQDLKLSTLLGVAILQVARQKHTI